MCDKITANHDKMRGVNADVIWTIGPRSVADLGHILAWVKALHTLYTGNSSTYALSVVVHIGCSLTCGPVHP